MSILALRGGRGWGLKNSANNIFLPAEKISNGAVMAAGLSLAKFRGPSSEPQDAYSGHRQRGATAETVVLTAYRSVSGLWQALKDCRWLSRYSTETEQMLLR